MGRVLAIEGMSHDGRGIVRVDGKVGFVEGALPDEEVEAQLLRRHRRLDEYRVERVRVPSPDRVVPPCPLVGQCGGCDLQHASAAAQRRYKQAALLELLERQGRAVPEQLDAPLDSEPFAYRRRARLALFVPSRGAPVLGFREAAGRRVVPVADCPVLVPLLSNLPAALRDLIATLQAPRSIGHVDLALAEEAGGLERAVIGLHLAAPLAEADRARWQAFATGQGAHLELRAPDGGRERLHQPGEETPAYRLPDFALRMGFRAGDFLQGNAAVNRALVARVVERLALRPGLRVLDAFAGLGNFSLPLARAGALVHAVDVVPELVERGRDNALANGVEGVVFSVGDLDAAVPTLPAGGIDAAVLDPPRTGARALVQALIERRVERILYVSCMPATLARDARLLVEGGYRLARLAPVDMFPQTHHGEALAVFELDPAARRARRGPAVSRRPPSPGRGRPRDRGTP